MIGLPHVQEIMIMLSHFDAISKRGGRTDLTDGQNYNLLLYHCCADARKYLLPAIGGYIAT